MDIQRKKLANPDEVRTFVSNGRADIFQFEEGAVGHLVMEPGWQWSKHVKPIAGTPTCQSSHMLYMLKGRLHIRMDDGAEGEVAAGEIVTISPGHDAWVVGNEAVELIDFSGMEHYAKRREEAGAAAH